MKSIKFLFAIAALSATGIATAGPQSVSSVTVRYGDLNLNSQAGVASLHQRIRNAAETVCSPLESRVLGLRDAFDLCVTDAVKQGVAAVGNANLTQFQASKGKGVVIASN
jgi:UrcA family protein